MIKAPCGCQITNDNIFEPCKKHWQLMHDSTMFKITTGGEIDMDASVDLGVPIVKSCPPTWMKPEEYEKIIKQLD